MENGLIPHLYVAVENWEGSLSCRGSHKGVMGPSLALGSPAQGSGAGKSNHLKS